MVSAACAIPSSFARYDTATPDTYTEHIVSRVLARLRDESSAAPQSSQWLAPAAAAAYLGVPRRRIYDLRSLRAIEPDGFDGRTPLFTRATLDAYARGEGR